MTNQLAGQRAEFHRTATLGQVWAALDLEAARHGNTRALLVAAEAELAEARAQMGRSIGWVV